MKQLLKTSLLIIVLLLAACGSDGASTSESDVPLANTSSETTDATGFTSTITGAVETELNGRGYFMCSEFELTIGANGGLSNNILITLPRDASAGITYEMADEKTDEEASAIYAGDAIPQDYYSGDVVGSITLDAVPSQNGERAAGSFEFTASTRDDATVTVTGSFDFNVDSSIAFFECSNE